MGDQLINTGRARLIQTQSDGTCFKVMTSKFSKNVFFFDLKIENV